MSSTWDTCITHSFLKGSGIITEEGQRTPEARGTNICSKIVHVRHDDTIACINSCQLWLHA